MCYDPDDDVALTAIDAVERFKDMRALPALKELAEHHPSRSVRTEARKAADRLQVRASLVPQTHPIPPAPLYACYLTTIDGSGGQMALLARDQPDGTLEMAAVMFDDQEGIAQCSGAHVSLDELGATLEGLTEQGLSPVSVPYGHCLEVLDQAIATTWKAERMLPTSFVAWRNVIEGGKVEKETTLPPLVIPWEKREELLDRCYELLLQDEFAFWFFNPDEIGDLDARYLDRFAKRSSEALSILDTVSGKAAQREMGSEADTSTLRRLLRDGVHEIVTDRLRTLIQSRLLRVAPLLRELYEEDEVWQWAVVAADALADGSLLPAEEHPLLLGMIACSLENAIGEAIEWVDPQVVARRE
jgi:hypothetical protein